MNPQQQNDMPQDFSIEKAAKLLELAGITDNTAVLKMLLQTQTAKNTQDAKLEKEKRKEQKEKERIKKQKRKEKERNRPIKETKRYFKQLTKIEKVFDLTQAVQHEAVRGQINAWLYNSMEAFNVFIKGEKSNDCFRRNSVSFMKLIQRIQQVDNFGIITSNNQKVRAKFFVKTEYGILSGRQANAYLKYIIREKCIEPFKQVASRKLKQEMDKEKRDIEGSLDNTDMYLQLSFHQLITDTSLEDMLNYIVKTGYNSEFAKSYQKACMYSSELISDLPESVKRDMIKAKTCNDTIMENSSESEYSDESDSESDSDSDSDSE
jgi:hypothetical protein